MRSTLAFFVSLQALRSVSGKCVHAGSVVEEGLQWDIKVNSSDDIRAQRVNKSLAAMLVLRSAHMALLHDGSWHSSHQSFLLELVMCSCWLSKCSDSHRAGNYMLKQLYKLAMDESTHPSLLITASQTNLWKLARRPG